MVSDPEFAPSRMLPGAWHALAAVRKADQAESLAVLQFLVALLVAPLKVIQEARTADLTVAAAVWA